MQGSTFSKCGGGPVGAMEGRERGHGVGERAHRLGGGGWLTSRREALWGGCGVRGVSGGGYRASCGGRGCYTMLHDVTGHARRNVAGGCLHEWPIPWQPSKRARGV